MENKEKHNHNATNMFIVDVAKNEEETAKRDYSWGGGYGDYGDMPFMNNFFLPKRNAKVALHV